MELIPILSLIILVATISTFILAVGAYILYKARERKGISAEAPQPAAIAAEMVTPTPLITEQRVPEQGRKTFEILQSQRDSAKGPELKPTFVGSETGERYQRRTSESPRTSEGERFVGRKKFMRFTNEGYIEPSREEKNKEDNLRWR